MARPATGSVVAPKGTRKSWQIRYRVNGKRITESIGRPEDGVTRTRAEEVLADRLAEVRLGTWKPQRPEPAAPVADTGAIVFHDFAEDWLESRKPELRPQSIEDLTWCLEHHLLDFFGPMPIDAISIAEVDRYKAGKLTEGRIAPAQINKTLKCLAQIYDSAIEYGHTEKANPARGRRRRVKVEKPRRSVVEPEQLLALFDSAPKGHRAVLATLAGAGLRVGELCALEWRDLDLSTGTLTVRASKTAAGLRREVDLPAALVTELWTLAATSSRTEPNDPVFVGGRGTRQTPQNIARRLKTAIKAANPKLEDLGIAPISERVSPHSLRRSFASLRFACGDDPAYVAEQGGWEDPGFVLRVYARAVKRRQKLTGAHLEQFDAAIQWAQLGAGVASESSSDSEASDAKAEETAT